MIKKSLMFYMNRAYVETKYILSKFDSIKLKLSALPLPLQYTPSTPHIKTIQ